MTDDFCLTFEPITVADEDQLTDTTAKMILTDDEAWKERCKSR